ncbi:MAG TPA: endonuclease/exonuclease/phosphatase family protein [Rhodothermales bacterium]|nr:endonuclease/exonuclease/phosphatase family protein [Rhodothermales bacterium]
MIRRLSLSLLLLLDGLLLVLFVVGYASRYVPSRFFWWAEVVATGLPYLSMVLVVVTITVALMQRWRLLAVHVVLLVLALLRFASFGGGAEPQPDDLVLLTFNTSKGGGAQAEEQGHAITKLVRIEDPDIVALQESSVEFHPTGRRIRPIVPIRALIDSLGYHIIGPDGEREAVYTKQPVLAEVELVEQTQRLLHEDNMGTGVVRTHFRWKGREAVHYNLHLHSFGYTKPWEDAGRNIYSFSFWKRYLLQYRDAYLDRAAEMRKVQAMLAEETLPVIVSGDFNSTPHNHAFYGIAQGLQDAFKVAGQGWGATYRADRPFARIDHVLASNEWEVVSAHVTKADHSDHRALIVRLRWAE